MRLRESEQVATLAPVVGSDEEDVLPAEMVDSPAPSSEPGSEED
jgi:hypothetical protein